MQAEGANNAVITDLQKRLATAQFDVSMTQEKVQAVIWRHRLNTLQLVDESLEKGWKTWSAAELWLLRTERENQKAQGSGFFKMSEEAIAIVQEDIAKDICEIAAFYKEEINMIMQEFDKHDVDTSVQLDNLEAERVSKTPTLGATTQPSSSTEQTHSETDNEEDTEDDDDDVEFEPRHEGEPSLFDILDDDIDGDLDEDQQEWRKIPWVRRTTSWPTGIPGVTRTSMKASESEGAGVGIG